MTKPWLAILGLNEDGALSAEAAALLAGATLVMGGTRHLALAAPLIRGAARPWPSPIADAIPALLAHRPAPAAVLASGDPLWFGVASLLLRHVPLAETRIVPAPSSFALAAARLGWPLDRTPCLSCCGRPVEALRPHLHDGARLLVLCADATTPAAIAALLAIHGFAASTLHLLDALGGPHERIRSVATLPPDIHPLTLVAIEARGPPGLPLTPGRDEALFDHDHQITKREIRALTLAALAPRPGQLLWDIGCGSGAVGIEWMLAHPACRTVGLEARPDRAGRARRNAAALGVPALQVIDGHAPEALAALPRPDAIFLGGGATPAVIDAAWSALPPGGRLVANAIALPTELALAQAQARLGGTLTRIALERLDQVGALPAYRPAMTVTQWQAEKPFAAALPSRERPRMDALGPGPITAGLGCRKACPAEAITSIVQQAAKQANVQLQALAAPHFKRDEPGLLAAAQALGLPLRFIPEHALAAAQALCPTRSPAAERATGHASIAEACALAATSGRLLLPRIGNALATVAIAG